MKPCGFILMALLWPCITPCSIFAGQDGAKAAEVEVRVAAILRELGIEMVLVKGGTYRMGDFSGGGRRDEGPVHDVTVSDFLLGKTEVTQAQWEALMGANPSKFQGASNPVEQVSWDECQEFLRRLGEKAGGSFRLPTEAEWEYAARSGGRLERWAGTSNEEELGTFAWFNRNSGGQTHPVGEKKPNGRGLHDMNGNVWEWCSDRHDAAYYEVSPPNDPTGPSSGDFRVLRGGCYLDGTWFLRASSRFSADPGDRHDRLGVRLAATPGYQLLRK